MTFAVKIQNCFNFLQRFKRLLFVLLAILLVIACSYLLVNGNNIVVAKPISAFSIVSKNKFTKEIDIRQVLAKGEKLQPYFKQDISKVKDKIMQIPWVKNVNVHKIYPDALKIYIEEYQPFAFYNQNSLITTTGDVFTLPAIRFKANKLPMIEAKNISPKEAISLWHKLQIELKQRNLVIKKLQINEIKAGIIVLANNIELKLGVGNWANKIDLFLKLLPKIKVPLGKKINYIDLRYQNGLAVGFKNL